jgi:hypothetical protein
MTFAEQTGLADVLQSRRTRFVLAARLARNETQKEQKPVDESKTASSRRQSSQ